MRKPFIPMLIACAFIAAAAAACAEDVKFPEVKEGKVIQDNWYGMFAEGKKIGYVHTVMSEAELDGKPCLLIQSTETGETKTDGATGKIEIAGRMIVNKNDMTPMFYSANTVTPKLKYSITAKVEKNDGKWTATVTKTLNDKSETESAQLDAPEAVYFKDVLPLLYRDKFLAEKKEADFWYIDFAEMKAHTTRYTYKEEITEGEGENARKFNVVVAGGEETLFFTADGILERETPQFGILTLLLSDEQKAKNFDEKLDGYKAPDYLTGDVLTVKEFGLKITCPDASYVPMLIPNLPVFGFLYPFTQTGIAGFFVHEIPEGTEYAAALKRMTSFWDVTNAVVGEGKEVEIGKQKCFSGPLTRGKGVLAESGEYYIFINGKRMLMLTATSKGDLFAGMKADVIKAIESIEFIEPEFDKDSMLVTDEATGVQFTLPNRNWSALHGLARGAKTMAMNFWNQAYFFVATMEPPGGMKAEDMIALLGNGKDVVNKGDVQIGDYAGIWTETEAAQPNGITLVTRTIYVVRNNVIVFITFMAPKEMWKALEAERDALIKSLAFPVRT
jgi:hypothetical protein